MPLQTANSESMSESQTKIAELNSQISLQTEKMETHYAELGKVFFSQHSEDAELSQDILSHIQFVKNALLQIEDLNKQIESLQNAPKCPACGSPLDEDAIFCPMCGTSLHKPPSHSETHLTCSNCGSAISEGDLFCCICGHPVSSQSSQKKCPNCNYPLDAESIFCPSCGQKVSN